MKTWYVKELSKLTSVSVRTLHYYDKIGLLKPSDRLPNGYRVYSDQDVRKLEQIIVLKFFGFTLARIKQILAYEELTLEQLETQLLLLQSEVSFLQEVQRNLLLGSIKEFKRNASIDWNNLVELINESTKASKEMAHQAQKTLSQPQNKQKKALKEHVEQEIWQILLSKIHTYENTNNS